jgi:ABC-type lipoprotein export system ATPase subunit
MAAISRITIDGFKAFPDSFTLNLGEGSNLLMYGENGSGKSSIYYALYSLLQSQCKDKNSIYFDINSPESLVNQHTKKADAKVEIQFLGSDVTYMISKNGYQESVAQPVSPLKDLNGKCVFINHKFLFNVFSFRNSQFIDLFPVFIKDILPFTLTRDQSQYISQLYEGIIAGIEQKRKRTAKSYSDEISNFNEELQEVIRKVNETGIPAASELYNKFFRNEDEPELRIQLIYDNNIDHIPQPGKSYWLRLGYRFKEVVVANVHKTERLSHRKELLSPVITLSVEEKQADGTYTAIKKPQTYFNEAKLTAIALAIRFSLLDTISQEDGRFIALDDMLISLDMSNRMKVIDYLLKKVIGKYKIYLFTHDRLFYHTFKRIIERNYDKSKWLFGGLYVNDIVSPFMPDFKPDDSSKIEDAHEAYAKHDYFRCGVLLRQMCEQKLKELLPASYRSKQDPQTAQTVEKNLDEQIVSLEDFCKHEQIDFTPFIKLKSYKDLFLNSTAHNDITSPFYRNEIKACLKAIDELSKIELKDINSTRDVSFQITDSHGIIHTIRIRLRETLKMLKNHADQRLSFYCKCEVLKDISEAGEIKINEGYESIYVAYQNFCAKYLIPETNIFDTLQDRNGYIRERIV